jgi:hypothetical protein
MIGLGAASGLRERLDPCLRPPALDRHGALTARRYCNNSVKTSSTSVAAFYCI